MNDDTSLADATKKLNELVLELNFVAKDFMTSSASEILKPEIFQNIVGIQRFAHRISQAIISEYEPRDDHHERQCNRHPLVSSEMAVVSRE